MDVFALTSLYEGLGLVLLEAMAAGIPVVAPRVGGIPEVISGEHVGILIEQRNPHLFAHAFTQLDHDQKLRQELVSTAKEHVRKHFSLQTMIQAYEKLYREVCLPRTEKSRLDENLN
jgi:glycosyltransferase involved in cell wall biosynthesis